MGRMADRVYRSALLTVLLASFLSPRAHSAAPSITPDMPAEVRSWREAILSREEYAALVEAWRSYADEHSASAVAKVQVARAMRYAGQGTPDEREALVREGLALDPGCPEALENLASLQLTMHGGFDEAMRLGEQAVAAAPSWPDPHFTLLSVAMVRGDAAAMRRHAEALLAKGGFSSPLLDFAYNLLASAEPDAIVLTNGDNDTYPLVALQLVRGIRPDLQVTNLSLLNLEEYAKNVWKGRSPAPWTEDEIGRRFRSWQDGREEKGLIFSQILLHDLRDRVRAGTWKDPVYLAITAAPTYTACCEDGLELEGLLWRVLAAERAPSAPGEPRQAVDAAKTMRLFRETFRLDSATDLAYAWGPNSAVGRLMENYPALLQRTGAALAEKGDLEGAGYALRTAIAMLEFHGQADKAATFREYWKQLDPAAK